MRQLGIIASRDERIEPSPKWYQFWRRRTDFEVIGLDVLQLELTVAYLPKKSHQYLKWLESTKELFLSQGIYNIVCTKKADYQEELECCDIKIHRGNELIERMVPKIIAKIAKMKNRKLQQTTLAYIDDSFSQNADQLLHDVSQECRYLLLMTKNEEKALQISKVLLEEYGIPIELVGEQAEKIECDFAILMDGKMPKVSTDTVIIDLQGNGFYEGRKTVNSIDLTMKENITKALPFAFKNTEILQALWKIGVIKQADLDKAKIIKMYYTGNDVDFVGKT